LAISLALSFASSVTSGFSGQLPGSVLLLVPRLALLLFLRIALLLLFSTHALRLPDRPVYQTQIS
jgi:hypothetical protein